MDHVMYVGSRRERMVLSTAPGWRYRQTRGDGYELIHEWHLWTGPVLVSAIPALLALGPDMGSYLPGETLRCGAVRREKERQYDPPVIISLTSEQIRAGRLDDEVHDLSTAEAVEWLKANGHPGITTNALSQALKRSRAARDAGETGAHIMEPPHRIGGTLRWSVHDLAAWRPLGTGARRHKM
jgi:hypothetical protein